MAGPHIPSRRSLQREHRRRWRAASCDAITLGTETSAAECNAVPSCVYQADSRLGGFTMDEVYTANSDVIIPLDGLSPGQHFMVASSSRGYGWQDGYWEVSDGSSVVAGGDSPPPLGGQVTGPTAFGPFETVEGTSYTLRIRAGANPDDMSWMIDDGSVLSGPARGTLVLGEEREGRNGYEGNFAGLSILRRPIDSFGDGHALGIFDSPLAAQRKPKQRKR